MPRNRAILGRPLSRRISFLLFCLALLALGLLSTWNSADPPPRGLAVGRDGNPHAPRRGEATSQDKFDPFVPPSQPPPRQRNDTFAGSSWWADDKWLAVPFSSMLTVDDHRALLPPLPKRQPIYCYYDPTLEKSREANDAQSELLLTWKRAWWSRGFRPVILGAAEATNNPAYLGLQKMDLDADLKADMMRWLAWDSMGGGLLAHYTLLPMESEEDVLLPFLRGGEYPVLTKWQALGSGLFAGQTAHVSAVVRAFNQPSLVKQSRDVVTAVRGDLFTVDPTPSPLAYYHSEVVERKYASVAKTMLQDRAQGLRSLDTLINSHLHNAWQHSFPEGILVLKPLPEHTTTITSGALKLAQSLAACAESPLPATCAPNVLKCTPCIAMSPMGITTPAFYRNSTRLFTIGTVPHPWTLGLLDNVREDLDISWIRSESERDPWLSKATQRLLGSGVSSSVRVVRFKDAVAGERHIGSSLWLTAEGEVSTDVAWHFGFAIPIRFIEDGKSMSPVPADRLVKQKPAPDRENGPVATEDDIAHEIMLLKRARDVIAMTKATAETRLRASLEAWNLGDTEAWKFARAFQARRHMEREEWEREEARNGRGSGRGKGGPAWSR